MTVIKPIAGVESAKNSNKYILMEAKDNIDQARSVLGIRALDWNGIPKVSDSNSSYSVV